MSESWVDSVHWLDGAIVFGLYLIGWAVLVLLAKTSKQPLRRDEREEDQ